MSQRQMRLHTLRFKTCSGRCSVVRDFGRGMSVFITWPRQNWLERAKSVCLSFLSYGFHCFHGFDVAVLRPSCSLATDRKKKNENEPWHKSRPVVCVSSVNKSCLFHAYFWFHHKQHSWTTNPEQRLWVEGTTLLCHVGGELIISDTPNWLNSHQSHVDDGGIRRRRATTTTTQRQPWLNFLYLFFFFWWTNNPERYKWWRRQTQLYTHLSSTKWA